MDMAEFKKKIKLWAWALIYFHGKITITVNHKKKIQIKSRFQHAISKNPLNHLWIHELLSQIPVQFDQPEPLHCTGMSKSHF